MGHEALLCASNVRRVPVHFLLQRHTPQLVGSTELPAEEEGLSLGQPGHDGNRATFQRETILKVLVMSEEQQYNLQHHQATAPGEEGAARCRSLN